jgi:hypothetical protein
MKSIPLIVLLVLTISGLGTAGAETKDAKIKRALAAAPANVAARAKVLDVDETGKMTVLRDGDNGFTCIPGHVGVIGDSPACMNAPALRWVLDFMAHKPKPTNTQPGILYQLAGGTDWSATDPGCLITWPFDPKSTGLPSSPKDTGVWIMWAGTPYAHLMINRCP